MSYDISPHRVYAEIDGLEYEFRSKLECVWAIWFDMLGLDWEYDDASWYDFFVTGWHVEIKPANEEIAQEGILRMAKALESNAEYDQAILLSGDPLTCEAFLVGSTCEFSDIEWEEYLCA